MGKHMEGVGDRVGERRDSGEVGGDFVNFMLLRKSFCTFYEVNS